MDSQSKNFMPEEKIAALEEKHRNLQEQTAALRKVIEDLEGARRRAEAEAAKYRLLFENATDGILVADCETHRFILANQRICQMLGYTQEELLRLRIEDIHPPEIVRQALELFGSLMRKEIDHLTDYPLLRKDGGLFHADITAGSITLDSRAAAVGFFRDVEERTQAREQLWQREAELAGLFRAAPIGIGLLVNRVFIKANQRLCEMVGYTEKELIGQSARMLYPTQEDFDYVGREKYNQIREKGTGTVETRWRTQDGRILHILLSSTPLDAGDWSQGITFTALDITDRKEAENQMAYQQRELSAIFHSVPVGISHVKGRSFQRVNQIFCQSLGYTIKELVGQKTRMLYRSEEEFDWWGEYLYKTLREQGEVTREITFRHKDGHCLDFLLRGVYADPQDPDKGYFFAFTDITELKRAEQALKFTQFAVEHMADSAFWMTSDARFFYVNEAACRNLGYSREELLTLGVPEIDPDYTADRWPENWQALKKAGARIFESRHRTKDGRVFPVEISDNFVAFGGQEYNCAFARDITDRKKIARDLGESQSRYFTLFKSANDGIFLMKDNRFIECNPKTLELFRCTQEEILNHTPFEFSPPVQPDGKPSEEKGTHLIQAAYAGQQQFFEWRHCRADKTEFDTEVSLNRMELKSGIFLQAIVRDVTERKQAEQAREKLLKELRAKNEELESIVFIASHDLRSPLVNIEGFTGEVNKSCLELRRLMGQISCDQEIRQQIDYLLEKEVPESIHFITAGTAKMDALLSGLLRLSRIGTATIHIDPVQMNLLIQTVLGAMRFEIQRLGAEIRTEDLPNCLGDAVQINQVFSNLIDNAIKYRHPDRPIQIRIRGTAQGNQVVYSVTDNGIGIDPQHHDKIFEIFHQLNPVGPQGGQGLGLTIVRRILDRLDGRIWVESALGAGSTFHVALPRVR
jgi:PAS domain S-box-containing protein